MKRIFVSKNAIPLFLLGILVFFCLSLLTCSKEEEDADLPDDEQTEDALTALQTAGDSIMTWSQNMSYPEAAQKGVEWLKTQSNVDRCGISKDYTVWIEFENGIGGDIFSPREAMDSKEIKDVKPLIIRNPGQGGIVKPIFPVVTIFLPFDRELQLHEDDILMEILVTEGDPNVELNMYRGSTVSPQLLTTLGSFIGPGLVWFTTAGGLSEDDEPLLATGEKVTYPYRDEYLDDMAVGWIRLGYLSVDGKEYPDKVYYTITPKFISEYWGKFDIMEELFAQVVFVMACHSFEVGLNDFSQAFEKADAYGGVEGDLSYDFIPELISKLFRPMVQDTFGLGQSQITHPPGGIFVIGWGDGVADVIFNRCFLSLDGVPLHGTMFGGFVDHAPLPEGGKQLIVSHILLDEWLNLVGSVTISMAGCEKGKHPIKKHCANFIIYQDYKSGLGYKLDSISTVPEWGGLSGTITLTSYDAQLRLATGTFSGTLGSWDASWPPQPPARTVTIQNGRFKGTFFQSDTYSTAGLSGFNMGLSKWRHNPFFLRKR